MNTHNIPEEYFEGKPVFRAIIQMLDEKGIEYEYLHHEPVRTSEEAAELRGQSLEIGGKALVIKVDKEFKLFVLSAAKRLNTKAIKQQFSAKKTRFATPEELLEMTTLVPGCVPPFGEPILPLPLHVDDSILANDKIAFNAGSLTDSVILNLSDYVGLVEYMQFHFTE